ncbi:MAG: DegT/DnrJ/EryC1/StrS family aminotransferase [Anaerolineae bacterium]
MRRVAIAEFVASPEQRRLVQEVLDSGRISEGPRVAQFERAWAEFVGSRFSVATNSGTSALMVGLLALRHRLGLPRGTKAITSALSFIATSNAIWHAGFEPVYVDVDPIRFHLLPDQVEALLAEGRPGEYGAIVPVHLMGYPAPMDRLLALGERYGVAVVEDAAQAHGSVYRGRRVGSLGVLGIFSFYISHNIQAGEMGAITTDDEAVDGLARRLKDQGRVYRTGEDLPRWFVHDLVGFNFKTLEFQAALALPQVAEAEAILRARRENVRGLNERLADLEEWFQLPEYDDAVGYLGYPLVVRPEAPFSRDAWCALLSARGIETRPLFRSIPTQQPAYAHLAEAYAGRVPNAEYLGERGFYLGCHQHLTSDDLDYVAETFADLARAWRTG